MSEFSRLGRTFDELVSDRECALDVRAYDGTIETIVCQMTAALLHRRRIYWCGNGGSAAQAQHLAAEFSGRFLRERRGLPSEALSVNTSTITAIGNDFGYDVVFSRQVEAFVEPGDVVIALTTSGTSANLIRALKAARKIGATAIALSGNGGGPIADIADVCLIGPDGYSAIIQELHLIVGHILCDLVEQRVMAAEASLIS